MRADFLGRLLAAVLAFVAFFAIEPARAQLSAQQTYIASSSGGANAFVVVVPNVTAAADLLGVPLRVLMSASNSSAATLQVNAPGGSTIVAATAINKLTTGGLAALTAQGGSEIVAGQINTYVYDGTVFELLSPNLFTGTIPAQSGFDTPVNLSLTCTAAANALTCQMLAANIAATPTANNPIYIPFRDTTLTTGDPVWITISSAVSFTISGGNTMGCSSGAPCRLWITAINNAGTVLLGLSNQSTATQVFPLNEGIMQTTGSGTGGGSTAGTIFTSVSAVATKAIRIIGYVEITNLVTAGNWTSPNFVQLFGPGIARPGGVVQLVTANSATTATPAITPTSAANRVKVSAAGECDQSASGIVTTSVTRNAGSIGRTMAVGVVATGVSDSRFDTTIVMMDSPATVSSTTYGLSCTGVNANQTVTVEEIMGALEPANDDMPAMMAG